MRKYLATIVALTFLVFALGLMAQSNQNPNPSTGDQTSASSSSQYPGTSTGDQTSNPSSQNPSSQNPSSQPSSGASSSGTWSQSSPGQSEMHGKGKAVEGCITREDTDYFLVPKKGNPIRLNAGAGQNLSDHVGHQVKVHGSEMSAMGAGASGSMGAGATGTAGTSGTAAGTSGTQTGAGQAQPGVSSQTGATGTSGMGTSTSGAGTLHSMATKEINVDKIDMVATSCPANWNPNVPSSSGSSSNPPGK